MITCAQHGQPLLPQWEKGRAAARDEGGFRISSESVAPPLTRPRSARAPSPTRGAGDCGPGRLKRIRARHALLMAFIGFALTKTAQPGAAAGVEDFYKGRTVSIIIGYSAGGGYDTYARLLSRYL